MAKQDNAVKGLLDDYNKVVEFVGGKSDPKQAAPQKQDTSWHDEQVKEANDSFRKAAQSKASADPKLGMKKKSKTAKKKTKKAAKRS